MKIPRDSEGEGEVINMSSLLDVLFILIIFFLATSTFEEQERDQQVQLTQGDPTMPLSGKQNVVVINVRQDGSYYFVNETVDLATLQDRLVAARENNPDVTALVRGDRRVVHAAVADAILVCRQAGFGDAKIGYDELKSAVSP